jgi:peroxiredoxin
MTSRLTELPENLPVPIDDGACGHLVGHPLPKVFLRSTSGPLINLHSTHGLTILYVYPLTGRPDLPPPAGWNDIPGARGCTPEACGFRNHYSELRELSAEVFGLSTQSTDYQREARERLELPFDLLSDENFAFTDALHLPTFVVSSVRLLKRLTLMCKNGTIEYVFYPVFPPDQHAANVVAYLKSGRRTPQS